MNHQGALLWCLIVIVVKNTKILFRCKQLLNFIDIRHVLLRYKRQIFDPGTLLFRHLSSQHDTGEAAVSQHEEGGDGAVLDLHLPESRR
jgi:hypothetical protein